MAVQQPALDHSNSTISIEGEKSSVHQYERALNENGVYTAQEIQGRFDLLRDLSPDQMTALNKKVLRKLDWRMLPTITMMFLLK